MRGVCSNPYREGLEVGHALGKKAVVTRLEGGWKAVGRRSLSVDDTQGSPRSFGLCISARNFLVSSCCLYLGGNSLLTLFNHVTQRFCLLRSMR